MSLRTQDLPFEPAVNRFIVFFVDYDQDLARAAKTCRITVAKAKQFYRRPEVRVEIQKRLDVYLDEQAKLAAQSKKVDIRYLDSKLVIAVREGAKKGDIKALELGYERLGLRRDGNFMTQAQSTDQERPNIYRAIEQTVTQTVTQQVTQRLVESEIQDY